MQKLIFVSGPCGCGKTTFAEAYARHLCDSSGKTVYVIHGDSFHAGFVEREDKGDFFAGGEASDKITWEKILRFNWDCLTATAARALEDGLDVIIDYVIEGEFSRITKLAERYGAEIYYIVLTADAAEIERRIRSRGDTDLIGRALFLKSKLEAMPENQGHIIDNTDKTPEETVSEIRLERFLVGKKSG